MINSLAPGKGVYDFESVLFKQMYFLWMPLNRIGVKSALDLVMA